jgi:hypothetical protein
MGLKGEREACWVECGVGVVRRDLSADLDDGSRRMESGGDWHGASVGWALYSLVSVEKKNSPSPANVWLLGSDWISGKAQTGLLKRDITLVRSQKT